MAQKNKYDVDLIRELIDECIDNNEECITIKYEHIKKTIYEMDLFDYIDSCVGIVFNEKTEEEIFHITFSLRGFMDKIKPRVRHMFYLYGKHIDISEEEAVKALIKIKENERDCSAYQNNRYIKQKINEIKEMM